MQICQECGLPFLQIIEKRKYNYNGSVIRRRLVPACNCRSKVSAGTQIQTPNPATVEATQKIRKSDVARLVAELTDQLRISSPGRSCGSTALHRGLPQYNTNWRR